MEIRPIGIVHSTRAEIKDDHWLKEDAYIELTEDYPPDALAGLTDFSHVEILFHMNKVDQTKIETSARHPRNNTEWPKIGIFAQRGKNRPNQIGLTICEVQRVEGRKLFVRGLDAIDQTPVLDIKPWLKEFGPRGAHNQPEWSTELMTSYWLSSEPAPAAAPGLAPGPEPATVPVPVPVQLSTPTPQVPTIFDPIHLDTEHVKIRPLKFVTWQKLAEGLLYEGSFHATNWGIKTDQDIQKMYFEALTALQERRSHPVVFLSPDESEVLGMTSFMNIEPQNKMIEIGGTWINKKYQRSIINTETKFALLRYAFEILKLNRVEFRIDGGNVNSQRAVERLGFHFDGLMPRRKLNAQMDVRDYVFYSVTDQTWPQIKTHIQDLLEKPKLKEFSSIQKIKDLRQEGQTEQAFRATQTALAQFPNSPHLHDLAAGLCDAFRTEAEAVPFYQRALELGLKGFDRRDALLGLGSTFRSLGKYEDAKKTFELGIQEFPEHRPFKVFLALVEFNLNQQDQAVKLLLDQLLESTSDQDIRSYQRALEFYSTRLSEIFS